MFSASGRVGSPSARVDYCGYVVTVTTATAAINIREATNSSGAEITNGPIIDVIPAATAAGAARLLPLPLNGNNGIYMDFGSATGTIRLLAR